MATFITIIFLASMGAAMTTPKIVFITGATSGIGLATALRFARSGGWHIVAVGRRADRLGALKDELRSAVTTLRLDVRDFDAMTVAIESLPVDLRRPDLLINNAGTVHRSPLHLAELSDLRAVIETNVEALVILTRQLLPSIVEKQGAIINVSSTAANYPHGNSVVYGASKAFISHFSAGLRSDLRGTGVRVTTIEPGRTTTEILDGGHYVQLSRIDVADAMFAIAELPRHVNVNKLELMPTSQSLAGYQFAPKPTDVPAQVHA